MTVVSALIAPPTKPETKMPSVDPKQKKLQLAPSELTHFEFGAATWAIKSVALVPIVRLYARNGFRKPTDVSRLLNQNQVRTACGAPWTPRLAAILLNLIFSGRHPERLDAHSRGNPTARPVSHRASPGPAKSLAPSAGQKPSNLPTARGILPIKLSSALLSEHSSQRLRPHVPPGKQRGPVPREISMPTRFLQRLPSMSFPDTRQVWLNALVVIGDEARTSLHAAARQQLVAIEDEWARRNLQPELGDEYFPWPSTWAPGGDGSLTGTNWLLIGPLAFLGYHVGRTKGLPSLTRRAILGRVFVGVIPPVFPREYTAEWGTPASSARLRKLAESIAAFARHAKRRNQTVLDDAIRDWESDLQFLYDEYYLGRFRFTWPATG